jgi:hypothetical protein
MTPAGGVIGAEDEVSKIAFIIGEENPALFVGMGQDFLIQYSGVADWAGWRGCGLRWGRPAPGPAPPFGEGGGFAPGRAAHNPASPQPRKEVSWQLPKTWSPTRQHVPIRSGGTGGTLLSRWRHLLSRQLNE